jgi:hypothetical protein
MKKLVPLALLGCLGLGAAVHRLTRHEGGAPGPGGQETATACTFAPGTTLSYALQVTTEGKVDPAATGGPLPAGVRIEAPGTAPGPAGQAPTSARKAVHGTKVFLDLRSLSGGRSGNVLLARLRELDRETAAITGELDPPFLLRVDGTCNITGFARLDTARVAAARTQQALAHELQWTMPQAASGTGTGSNNLGAFVA